MKRFLLLLSMLFCLNAFADFPENDLWKEDGMYLTSMSQQTFDKIIDGVAAAYAPIIAAHGAKLTISHLWSDPTVNANASKTGSNWHLNMYGGLARRPEVTEDGFASVVCHEMGHLLGGFPFYTGEEMATEGQADYWATQACSKKVWGKSQNSGARGEVSPFVKKNCDKMYKTAPEQELCYRTAVAGQSLANLLAKLGGDPQPDYATPDQKVVSSTYQAHPAAQCRLDTYLQGALCAVKFNQAIMPGSQIEAFKYSCGNGIGARPKCWFKAQ